MLATVNGQTVNYSRIGEGDFVFLLHGWGASLDAFGPLSAFLAKKYTVVSFDFPGFGKSPEPQTAWNVSDYRDLTVEFIKQFGCKNIVLFGHSFGARIIIKMAARANLPFAVRKIILTGAAGLSPKKTLKKTARGGLFKAGKFFLSLGPLNRLFPNAAENLKKRLGSADYAAASPIMRDTLVKTVNESLEPFLPLVKTQTLLIWGENDAVTPLSDGQKMEKILRGANCDAGLAVVKNAGHYAFLDAPGVFYAIIGSFLGVGA